MKKIKIYGEIVAFSNNANSFDIAILTNQLDALNVVENDVLTVAINTYGGCINSGFAMYNLLRRFATDNKCTITTIVDGYCASIGTVLLLAGDKRIGNQFSNPFVHNAQTIAVGDSNDFNSIASELKIENEKIAKFYSETINIDFETAINLMNNSTWINSDDALKYGFFTELENQKTVTTNQNNMNKESNFYNHLKSFFAPKNKIIFDAENNEIDFFELPDNQDPKVGDKANYKGQPADGEVLSATGQTMIFDKGTLVEIVAPADSETESEEVTNLKNENEVLKQKIADLETTNNANTAVLNNFKNLYSEYKLEEQKQNGQVHNQINQTSDFLTALKKVK